MSVQNRYYAIVKTRLATIEDQNNFFCLPKQVKSCKLKYYLYIMNYNEILMLSFLYIAQGIN